LKFAIE